MTMASLSNVLVEVEDRNYTGDAASEEEESYRGDFGGMGKCNVRGRGDMMLEDRRTIWSAKGGVVEKSYMRCGLYEGDKSSTLKETYGRKLGKWEALDVDMKSRRVDRGHRDGKQQSFACKKASLL